jgi:hypothetical protein
MRFTRDWAPALLASVVFVSFSSTLLAQSKVPARDGAVAAFSTRTATNGILSLSIEDSDPSDLGMFTVTTGASHPNPSQLVLYPVGTSYISLRDATASVIYANVGSASAGLSGYTFANMNTAGTAVVTNIGTTGYRTTWTFPNWTLVQDVVINGSTLSDTNVLQTVSVTNTSGAPRQYGLRFMWDWDIAGNDASVFRTRNPDTAFGTNFTTYNNPAFQLYEETNSLTTPVFSVFGTVAGGPLNPSPTAPEQLRYASWGTSYGAAWDFTNTGGASDSSVVYYWGFNAPLTVAAGATVSYSQYLTTNPAAVGGGGVTNPLVPVPTLSQWGMFILIALLGVASLVALRRKS